KLFLFSLSFFIVTVNAKCPFASASDKEDSVVDRKLAAKKYGDTAHSDIAGSFLKDNMLGHGHKAHRQLKRPPIKRVPRGPRGPRTSQCLPVEALASQVAHVRETFAPNIDSDGNPAPNLYSICSYRAGLSIVDGDGTVERISGYAFAELEYRPGFSPPSDAFMLWVDNESPFLAQLELGFNDLVPGPDLFQGVFDTTKGDIDFVTTSRAEGELGGGQEDYDFMLHCEPIPSGGFRGYSHGSMFCESTATRVAGVFEEPDTFSNSYTFFLVPGGTSDEYVCPCAAEEVEITCEEKCNLGTNRHWAEVSIGGICESLANEQPAQFGPDGCKFETCCTRGTN
ncbi:hypothetical protein TrRE_jg9542, partial [Triparma retinervis]